MISTWALTRRALLGGGVATSAAVAMAACGMPGSQSNKTDMVGKEVLWGTYLAPSDPRADMVKSAWRTVEQMTGIKITVIEETSNIIWDKRQTEFASGSTGVDITYLTTAWHVPGGLRGMLVDLNPLAKRDKYDLSQYYKGAIDTWSWKGHLWGLAFALGFEAVLYNKAHFLAKGVKLPTKDWTYDDFLAACQKLNDPANNRWAVDVQQNGLHYMMGTFVLNYGGKRLNDAKDKALWGDDPKSIQGAQLDVDLHTTYRYTPPPEARATIPAGKFPIEVNMAAMEIDGLFRHSNIRPAIGAENLDFAPPPRGPGGQFTAVGGNSWEIMSLSKVKDAAWEALKANHSKEALLGPQIGSIAWPPIIWAANSPQWLDQFKGTHVVEAQDVAQKFPHDYMIVPEGQNMLDLANTPMNSALKGEISVTEAMKKGTDAVNALFARRPPEWR